MRMRISPSAFFQTNTEMAERLYRLAIEYAAPAGSDRVYDLYCGIGTIGLLMAPRVREVWGLELVEEAIADAIANARLNEVENAHFFAGDVRLALRELVERAGRPDMLVVDPPRSGLSQKVVRRVIEAGPRRIVYVSCNPTTLAPNAAQLVTDGGYRLRRVRAVDMFPQTPHIECVALLRTRVRVVALAPWTLRLARRPCWFVRARRGRPPGRVPGWLPRRRAGSAPLVPRIARLTARHAGRRAVRRGVPRRRSDVLATGRCAGAATTSPFMDLGIGRTPSDSYARSSGPPGLQLGADWPSQPRALWLDDRSTVVRGGRWRSSPSTGSLDGVPSTRRVAGAPERPRAPPVQPAGVAATRGHREQPGDAHRLHNGRVVVRTRQHRISAGNRRRNLPGVRALRSQVMRGTNPDGSHYADRAMGRLLQRRRRRPLHAAFVLRVAAEPRLHRVALRRRRALGLLTYGTLVTVLS